MSDPTRLLDDPDVPVELGEDLRHAVGNPSQLHDAQAGLAHLRASITATGTGAAAAATTSVLVPTLGAIAAVVAVALAVGWFAWSRVGPPPPAVSEPAESADAIAEDAVPAHPRSGPMPRSAEPPPLEVPAVDPPSGAPGDPASPPTEARAPRHEASPIPPAPMDPDELLRLETMQLARVRQLLDGDPAAALRLADEGQQRFRGGMFGEEREAFAVLALDRLGRRAAVRRRGAVFLRRHPAGPFSAEIRQLLESP